MAWGVGSGELGEVSMGSSWGIGGVGRGGEGGMVDVSCWGEDVSLSIDGGGCVEGDVVSLSMDEGVYDGDGCLGRENGEGGRSGGMV